MNTMSNITVSHATEGTLADVCLDIPKRALTVFTGLSGSGKSTLLLDVLFNECQRQYLEAMGMEGIRKPRVERITGASPAVLVTQSDVNRNPRSTVGTATDIYTDLRMVFEKLHVRACPCCGEEICAANCQEETERDGDEFLVFMRCSLCGHRMRKITRTEFSFNTKEGACPVCEGIGKTLAIDWSRVLHEDRSVEDGAVDAWNHRYQAYQADALQRAFRHYGLPDAKSLPVAQFDSLQREILLQGTESPALSQALPNVEPPKTVAAGRFEGVEPLLMRRLAEREGAARDDLAQAYFASAECPACNGERLGTAGRQAHIDGMRLPELASATLDELQSWVADLAGALSCEHRPLVEDHLRDIETKLNRLRSLGLDYLSLDRQTVTLSGGELQRMRLAAVLDSELTDVVYIMDEPTAGLHPRDTAGMTATLKQLRDKGNTVLVIEHDPDVMREADFIVDMGPGAGRRGGRVVAQGTVEEIERSGASVTGSWLKAPRPGKTTFRPFASTALEVRNARVHNLQGIDVRIPEQCLVTVCGPSGSGKSTLVFDLIAQGDRPGTQNAVAGLDRFDRIIQVDQTPLARMKRSNVATYAGVYEGIRKAFSATAQAKAAGLTARSFSFNSPGGRCERCEGLGRVSSNMLFFLDVETTCPACHGRRFSEEVLDVRYNGLSIDEALALPVDEASSAFEALPKSARALRLLEDVGLGYVQLGQTLATLSGGEAQRLKLAKELIAGSSKSSLYLLDEPTRGMHPQDVEHFLNLVDRLVDAGGTAIIVEHNAHVIERSDWVVELGPEGGRKGGCIVFEGTPAKLKSAETETARYLRRS